MSDPHPLYLIIVWSISHINDDLDAVLLQKLLDFLAMVDSTIVKEEGETFSLECLKKT